VDTTKATPEQLQALRRFFHMMNYGMVFLWKIGMGKLINGWPAVGGRIMVIRHCGRKSGREYLTPVNYAIVENEVYAAAGFGPETDWYRNIMVRPAVEIWLPSGRRRARASDVTESPCRAKLLREITIAAGLAGPLMGVDQRKLSDEQLLKIAGHYRIVHFVLEP
jgi:deazaflavin-dependent oxidoreductase (nitroreductase family)